MIYGLLGILCQVFLSVCGLYKIKVAHEVISIDMLVGVGSYGISFVLWLWLLRVYPVSIIFPVATSLNLVATELMSILILRESLTFPQVLALFLIFIAVFLLSFTGEKSV